MREAKNAWNFESDGITICYISIEKVESKIGMKIPQTAEINILFFPYT